MELPDQEVLEEAVELSQAVFSSGQTYFESEYDGLLDEYIIIEDVRNRIESATMDIGDPVYPADLEPFDSFESEGENYAGIFGMVEPGMDLSGFADALDISEGYASKLVGELEDAGLVETSGNTSAKEYFYGEEALPYLMVLDEAERLVEETDNVTEVEEVEEVDEAEDTPEPETDDEEETDYREIMMDVADSEDDLVETHEQRDDGGLESRDHTGTETEDTSNPSDDSYYEGW
jgi:DNA-binding transcriptional regulator GbsR (MarR family)